MDSEYELDAKPKLDCVPELLAESAMSLSSMGTTVVCSF